MKPAIHEGSPFRAGVAAAPVFDDIRSLAQIVVDALDLEPPRYVEALLGRWWTWFWPHRKLSELRMVSLWKLRRTIKYLVAVTVPSVIAKPSAAKEGGLFVHPSKIFRQADPDGRLDSFPEEAWFFVNGLVATEALARIQAQSLARLVCRPFTIIHNATDSVGVDVIEAVIGMGWGVATRPARKAYRVLREALEDEDKERVIVVCYSQGAIIMSNVLRALGDPGFKAKLFAPQPGEGDGSGEPCPPDLADRALLGKLEIYAFANCALSMRYDAELLARGVRAPWIESFANRYDLVARLGMLAPRQERHGIVIDGGKYVQERKWGHLLNEHYLFEIYDCLAAGAREEPYPLVPEAGACRNGTPRLYGYFGGRTPAPYQS